MSFHKSRHTAQCLVFISLFISVLTETTVNRTATRKRKMPRIPGIPGLFPDFFAEGRQLGCRRISLPKNPHVFLSDPWQLDYPNRAKIMYMCEIGYVIVGWAERYCIGGKWLPEMEEPECEVEKLHRFMAPAKTPEITRGKIVEYMAIPLTIVFSLVLLFKLRRYRPKRNLQSGIRSSPDQREDTRRPQLLPTRAIRNHGQVARPYQPNAVITALPPNILNSEQFSMPLTVMKDDRKPPSYEEATSPTTDSSLPTFEEWQKLANSSDIYHQ